MVRWIRSLFIFNLLIAAQTLWAANTIRVTSGEWPPYLSQRLPQGGYATQITTEAFALVGMDLEVGYYPWKRSYKYATDGSDRDNNSWHGSLVWSKNQTREQDFYYSDSIFSEEEVLFHLKDSPLNWHDISDLTGKTIGGSLAAYPNLEKSAKDGLITFHVSGEPHALLKRLFHHKMDAVAINKRVALYYLDNYFSPSEKKLFAYSPTVLKLRQYHLILSKTNPENKLVIERFNLGLKKLKENGRYRELSRLLSDGHYAMSKEVAQK